MGKRLPIPKAFEVMRKAGGAWRRLYSLRSMRFKTSLTTSREGTISAMAAGLLWSST